MFKIQCFSDYKLTYVHYKNAVNTKSKKNNVNILVNGF